MNNQVREIEDSAAVSGKRARSDRLAEKFELAELALWRVAGPVSVVSSGAHGPSGPWIAWEPQLPPTLCFWRTKNCNYSK